MLFVSHNMVAVHQLCQIGMVLNQGKLALWGNIKNAINSYIQSVKKIQIINLAERCDRQGSRWLKFVNVRFFDSYGNEQKQVISGQNVFIRFYYVSEKIMKDAIVNVAFNVRSSQGYLLVNLNSIDVDKPIMNLYSEGFLQCSWPNFNLRSGSYDCALFCSVNGDVVDWLQSAFEIQVEDGDFFGTGKIVNRNQGDFLTFYDWTSHSIQE